METNIKIDFEIVIKDAISISFGGCEDPSSQKYVLGITKTLDKLKTKEEVTLQELQSLYENIRNRYSHNTERGNLTALLELTSRGKNSIPILKSNITIVDRVGSKIFNKENPESKEILALFNESIVEKKNKDFEYIMKQAIIL